MVFSKLHGNSMGIKRCINNGTHMAPVEHRHEQGSPWYQSLSLFLNALVWQNRLLRSPNQSTQPRKRQHKIILYDNVLT